MADEKYSIDIDVNTKSINKATRAIAKLDKAISRLNRAGDRSNKISRATAGIQSKRLKQDKALAARSRQRAKIARARISESRALARVERQRISLENQDRSRAAASRVKKAIRLKSLTARRDRELASASKRRMRAQSKINKLNLSSSRLSASSAPVDRLGSSFGGLAKNAGAAAIQIAAVAAALSVGVIAKFTQAVISAKEFDTANRIAFESLLGGSVAAADAMASSEQIADRFGIKLEDVTGSMKKLLSAQFSLSKSKELIKMGADMRAISSSAEDVKGALRAISQIKSKGRLQGDELLQLAEAGVSQQLIFEELQKSLGVGSVGEVIKLKEAGKIDADTAINAIQAAVMKKTGSKEAGDAGERFADESLEAAANRIRNSRLNLFRDVAASSPEAFEKLADIGHKLADFLNDLDRDQLGEIFETAVTALDTLVELGKAFTSGFVDGLAENSDSTQDFFEALKDPEVLDSIREMGRSFGILLDVLTKIAALGGMAAALPEMAGIPTVSGASEVLEGHDEIAEANRVAGKGFGASLASGFAAGIRDGQPIAVASELAMAGAVKNAFTGPEPGIDAHSPSRVFEGLGGDVVDGFAKGLVQAPSQKAASGGGNPTPAGGAIGTTNNYSMGGMSVNTEVNEASDGEAIASQVAQSTMGILGKAFEHMALAGGTG